MTLFDAARGGSAKGVSSRAVVKMVVAYDGTDFSGFAAQPGQPAVRTVGGVLAQAIGKVLRHDVDLTCAGRTDAGVHAWGQVVSFESEPGLDEWRLQSAVNSMLGPEVVVRSCEIVAPGFDARHGAQWRRYRYTIVNRPVPDPFRDRFVWWVPEPLDLRALRLAADPFVGEHDFASFCRKGPEGSSLTARLGFAVVRRRRRRAPLRDPRRLVLLADGARHRRHARRGRRGQAPAGRDVGGVARRRPRHGGPTRPAARVVPLGSRLLTRDRVARNRGSRGRREVGVGGLLELRHGEARRVLAGGSLAGDSRARRRCPCRRSTPPSP